MTRQLPALLLLNAALIFPMSDPLHAASETGPDIAWHDIAGGDVEGRAFGDMPRDRPFDRFPASAQEQIPESVWERSRMNAGMLVRFRTDAPEIHVRYRLLIEELTAPNMAATGASGIDLYARDASGAWRWVGVTRPRETAVSQSLLSGAEPVSREYMAYLPLFNSVDQLSFGVPARASWELLPPRKSKPIVFYGTSITHGRGASRPGTCHVAILGRRLDMPVVNLGFGGVGRMDPPVGEYLAKIDAAVYVIDCLPNMDAALVRERCIPFVTRLRAARPETPIVLVEDRRNANSWILPARDHYHTENHAALHECYAALLSSGIGGIVYLSGDGLFGSDNDGSVDGSHPTDLGYFRQADRFEPALRVALRMRDPVSTP